MLFWLTSMLTSLGCVLVLGYLAFFNETLDAFLKVSLLFVLYYLVQTLPYIAEIKVTLFMPRNFICVHCNTAQQSAPLIFNILITLFASWLYLIFPPSLVEYYQYIITAIGPIYIIIESLQSVGLSIVIGENVTNWLSTSNEEGNSCHNYKKIFAVIAVIAMYTLSTCILLSAFSMESTQHWQISVDWMFIGISIGNIFIFLTAMYCDSGSVIQSALISLFLSYILFSVSSSDSHLLLQVAVVLIILLSIPPTMPQNENENESIFGKSTRLQSLIMALLVMLLTHVFMLWMDLKSLSVNMFWYRMFQAVLSVIAYLFILWKEQIAS